MTSQMEGGHRRIDRILDPSFVYGLEELTLQEVKRRRDDCLAEREYQSLLRRLVQGRLDVVRAETERRRTGEEESSLVERLARTLSQNGPSGPTRGEALKLLVPPEEMALARRRVEALVADPELSDPRALADEDLAAAAGRFEAEEHTVSADRAAVIAVHDRLQGELKRRYRADPSGVLTS